MLSVRWVIVEVTLPTVTVAVRFAPVAFLATAKVTLPSLFTALEIVSQAAEDVAVHVQPAPVVTWIEPTKLFAFSDWTVGVRTMLQGATTPPWVTVTV